jgi:AP endonuclease-1
MRYISGSSLLSASTNGRGNAFAVFLKNQRKWDSPAFKEEDITQFRELCIQEKYSPKTCRYFDDGTNCRDILPHGSYLVNLANPDGEKRAKAYECFLDELKRCEQLGIQLHNFQYTPHGS